MRYIFKNNLEDGIGTFGTLDKIILGKAICKEDGKAYNYMIPATDKGDYVQIEGFFYSLGNTEPVKGTLTNIDLCTPLGAWYNIEDDIWYPIFVPKEKFTIDELLKLLELKKHWR